MGLKFSTYLDKNLRVETKMHACNSLKS